MVLNLAEHKTVSSPNHSNIRQVTNKDLLMEYARVIAENWTPADQNVIDYYEKTAAHYLDKTHGLRLFIYYHEGQPVSCVELFPTDNQTIGFYGFATLEAYRGLGIGTTLMTYALNISKDSGYETAVFQGTEDGLGISKKYGFSPVSTYYEYA